MSWLHRQSAASEFVVPPSGGTNVSGRRSRDWPEFRLKAVLRTRAGFTLIELTISALLLGAVFVSVVPALQWMARERREFERRQLALIAAENVLDRVSALPWTELTAARAAEYELPESVQRNLPEAELEIDVSPDDPVPGAKRVAVELRWDDRGGARSPPVRLTAWVYRPPEGSP